MRRAQMLAVSVLLFAMQVQAQPSKNPETQKIADAFVAAWNKGDAKALAALHAEDAIRANPQGQVSVGRAAIEKTFAAALAGELKGTKLLVKSGDERTVTADLVVSSGTWEITGGTPPAGAATKGNYINTLVRQGGRWVIVSSAPITDTDQVTRAYRGGTAAKNRSHAAGQPALVLCRHPVTCRTTGEPLDDRDPRHGQQAKRSAPPIPPAAPVMRAVEAWARELVISWIERCFQKPTSVVSWQRLSAVACPKT